MRLRIRMLMIVVAALAVILGTIDHVRALIRAEDEFAMPILMLEGVAGSVLVGIGLAIAGLIRFVRKDDAYAAQLRRIDLPAKCPFPPAEVNSPDEV